MPLTKETRDKILTRLAEWFQGRKSLKLWTTKGRSFSYVFDCKNDNNNNNNNNNNNKNRFKMFVGRF